MHTYLEKKFDCANVHLEKNTELKVILNNMCYKGISYSFLQRLQSEKQAFIIFNYEDNRIRKNITGFFLFKRNEVKNILVIHLGLL